MAEGLSGFASGPASHRYTFTFLEASQCWHHQNGKLTRLMNSLPLRNVVPYPSQVVAPVAFVQALRSIPSKPWCNFIFFFGQYFAESFEFRSPLPLKWASLSACLDACSIVSVVAAAVQGWYVVCGRLFSRPMCMPEIAVLRQSIPRPHIGVSAYGNPRGTSWGRFSCHRTAAHMTLSKSSSNLAEMGRRTNLWIRRGIR